MPAEAVRNCGHDCEPFALASGINRMPLDLAARPKALLQRPTLARSAHRDRRGEFIGPVRKQLNHKNIRLAVVVVKPSLPEPTTFEVLSSGNEEL